jgi:putative ABC transport system permease protein
MSAHHPPRLAYALLKRCAPPGARGASMLGDLHEEYERFRPGWWRDLWYVFVALSIAAGYLLNRALHRPTRRHEIQRRGLSVWDSVAQDLRYAWRSLRRQPGYAVIAVATLALGIGANTAIFSVIYGSVLRPLPFPDAGRVMRIADQGQGSSPYAMSNMSVLNFLDLREEVELFEDLVPYVSWSATLSGDRAPRRLRGQRIGTGFFALLRMPPQLGREFLPEDLVPGAPPVAVVSDALWRREFEGDPDILGTMVTLNSVSYAVVGVASADFSFPHYNPDVSTPLVFSQDQLQRRRRRSIDGLGRLKAGVTPEAGLRELRTLFGRLEERYPEANEGRTMTALPVHQWMVGQRGPRLLRLFGGAVLLVLLIACVNVANLMIARSETRQRELAVRAALGASRLRLARHFLSESLLLALLGGALGAVAAVWGVDLLVALYGRSFPRAEEIGVNGVVLSFAMLVSLSAGSVVAIIPALRARPDRLHTALKQGGRVASGGLGVRQILVVSEMALAVVLVAGAGLLVNSVWRLSRVDLGVREDGVLTFNLALPQAKYETNASVTSFYGALVADLTTIPGVAEAGVTSRTPLRGGNNGWLSIVGVTDPEPRPLIELRNATPGFFHAVGIQLVAGRLFTADDHRQGANVVVVSEALGRALLPGADLVGRFVSAPDSDDSYEVVGVVSDIRDFGPERDAPPTIYWPLGGGPYGYRPWMTVTVRAAGDPLSVLPLIRDRVRVLDPDLPITDVATLRDLMADAIGTNRRSAMSLLGVFAGLALVLGAVGIYGVMSYTVAQRTRELGLRIALGATQGRVLRSVLHQGVRIAAVGVVLGLAGSVAASRLLSSFLFEVTAYDPGTLAAVAVILTATALVACYVPARRAARVEAMEALRHE